MHPKTRLSWKTKLKSWLAKRLDVGLPPVSAPSPTSLAPKTPFLSQEPVSEANRPAAVAQAARTRQVMDRICATNNANVTRNYGTRTEDQSRRVQPPALTAQDLADAATLLDVRVAPDRTTDSSYEAPSSCD